MKFINFNSDDIHIYIEIRTIMFKKKTYYFIVRWHNSFSYFDRFFFFEQRKLLSITSLLNFNYCIQNDQYFFYYSNYNKVFM